MKRLKIVEQIIIVLVLAVLIPFVTIGLIISNVSQQSVRNELINNASIIAQFVGSAIENYVSYSQSQLNQMASGFNYIPGTMTKLKYFDEIEAKSKLFKSLDILEKKELPESIYKVENEQISLVSPIDKENKYFLVAKININIIDSLLGASNLKGRNVYIFDSLTKEMIATNAPDSNVNEVLSGLEEQLKENVTIFGYKKNTPKAYHKLDNPDWFIVVDTTKKVTAKTILKARYRIVLSLLIGALSIIIMVSLYTYYLYINIRQLFKGITAISKGNYDKKIHLIKNAFTPHEIVFLAKEFNYMANKINISYRDLRSKNKELQNLNEFRQNLINATSHEFRTPLTSIIGYTSRLLRSDIVVDDETKINSLQVIKQQAQRLSKMVDDMLVIPELESQSLKYNIEEVDIAESLNRTLEYLQNDNIEFKVEVDSTLKYVYSDNYRLEQILINLISNSIKYNIDNNPIEITLKNNNEIPTLLIKNKCDKISDDIKDKLFDKFVRADSKLTRTTRGTGLGLYIVKGLCDDMKIDIKLNVDDFFAIELIFNDYVK